MLFSGQVVIVTGATRGIGKATLTRFAEEGASVIGVYANSVQLAAEITADLTTRGHSVQFLRGSVDDPAFIKQLMQQVKQQFGAIDVLVNNAGIIRDNFASMMTPAEWDDVFQTNFRGVYQGCVEAIPYMVEQGSGKVVNVVSVSGVCGREAQVNYSTAKGAVMGLTRMLARRYAAQGIHLNAIAPGMIDTDMISEIPEAKLARFLQYTNMQRPGKAEEIANSILFLASGMSDYVSDSVLRADGGFMR